MNRLSQRQLLGVVILTAATAAAALLTKLDANFLPFACIVWVAGVVGIFLPGSSVGAESLYELENTLRSLKDGRKPEPPADAALPLRRIYDETARVHELLQLSQSQARGDRAKILESLEVVAATSINLKTGIAVQLNASDETAIYVRETAAILRELSQHVDILAANAEETGTAVLQVSTTSEQVALNTSELGSTVRETVGAMEQMAYSIKEVARNIDALSLTAEETSSSMNQMDVSIDQVQSNANETARLSEEVAHDAERGAEAILKTIGEIYRIKESSQEAVAVISTLGSRIEAIGQILNVIDDVAEQTNLLALNAAIIAAQAGEHGKGFAVVADEIKDLAERAGSSTKEIADLIKTIQSESKNAIVAVERGAQNVDRGVEVSNEAERALKKILESSQKSTNMVRAIARATVEQSKGSKQVTEAISRIAQTVQQIAAAAAQQARGAEVIIKGSERMRTISQQVELSSQEQTRGSRQINQSVEGINRLVSQLATSQRNHTKSSEKALATAMQVEEAARRQETLLKELLGQNELVKKLLG